MRKARKPLCLLLCAVLLLSMSAAALGANNNYSSWFQTNYDEINKLGLMPASFNGLDLTKNITRGEMCELAVYAFEKATGNDIDMSNETFTGFTDTSKDVYKRQAYGLYQRFFSVSNTFLRKIAYFSAALIFSSVSSRTASRSFVR